MFLGIDTSSDVTQVALVENGELLCERSCFSGAGHNEVLVGMVRSALETVRRRVRDLTGVGVTIGPGMFTSLRVGLAVAKGLAVGLGIPVKGVSTFRALAAAVGEDDRVLILVDAKRGEVYAAVLQRGKFLVVPAIVRMDRLGDWLTGANSCYEGQHPAEPPLKLPIELTLAGNAVCLCSDLLRVQGVIFRDSGVVYPPARVIATLAARLLWQSGQDKCSDLEPCYLRRTDAELNRVPRSG